MTQISVDISRRLDIIMRKAETFSKIIRVINEDLTDFDFTDYSASLKVYTGPTDRTPQLVFDYSGGLTLSSGQILLEKDETETDIRRRDYIYFLWVTYPDDTIKLWLNGKVIVNEGLYDNGDEDTSLTINIDGSPITLEILAGGGSGSSSTVGNIDGGTASSIYGQITSIDGGGA